MKRRTRRKGIRIVGGRGHPVVRRAFIKFACWLRTQYGFPVRVPVYLTTGEYLRTIHGEWASASFFYPLDKDAEPYIRVASGDFDELRRARGRDNALGTFLHSLCHELVHYQQWLASGKCWERGVSVRAASIVRRYEKVTARP